MIGKTLAHYRIVERVGAGGMGEVYRARDTRLDRDVALKVLPAEWAGDAARLQRLHREARAAAALNHPNIVTLHSIEEDGGVQFLTMEFVEGQSLDELLPAGGFPLHKVAEIGVAVANALDAAHEKGIVHRDIKPANVMVTKNGTTKVLDFGLAKLAPVEARTEEVSTRDLMSTREGSVLGTLPYMSPEQIRVGEADHRSDVFSLGVLLFELATGQRPFQGATHSDLISSILRDQALPITQVRPDLPPELERIVARCLEKPPGARFQTAGEIADRLRELGAGASTPQAPVSPNRLAVLPFENIGGDPEQDFFVDGMHEEVLATLAGISGMEVISRRSVQRFRHKAVEMREIVRELRVNAIVEGSVRASGNQVRITVELVDVASDRHLWARSYQRELCDVLKLQGEVAQAIAREVKATLTPEEEAQLTRARPVDPESYHAYLMGRHHWAKRTTEGLTRAGEFFQAAIDADPTYAKAYAGLADVYLMKGAAFYTVMEPREAFPRGRAAASKAIELDPGLAEPHASLGYLKSFFDWDWDGAEKNFRRAIQLNPGYATAHLWFALHLTALSRFAEAFAAVDRALDFDPLSLIVIADKGWIHLAARDYQEAVRWSRKALDMDDRFAVAHWVLGQAQEELERYDDAEASFRRAIELVADNTVYPIALARTLALSGRGEEGARLVGDLLANCRDERILPHAFLAGALVAMGDTEEAMAALEKAYEKKENSMAMINVDPRLDPLRPHPRFQELVRRMSFPG